MTGRVDWVAGAVPDVDHDLEREFEARLDDSSTLAFRLAYSVLRNRQDAEDVAQEAFAKAFRSFGKLRDRGRFRAWLSRMTWRLALDRQRSNRRRVAREAAETAPSCAPTAHEEIDARQRAEALWAAIGSLPEKLRIVVVLANIEGHDIADVAALLNAPEGTIKSRLFDARRILREQLSWMRNSRSTR
jgi:RNA polymerase sigma-70 factor (ECF subfamily)